MVTCACRARSPYYGGYLYPNFDIFKQGIESVAALGPVSGLLVCLVVVGHHYCFPVVVFFLTRMEITLACLSLCSFYES